MPRRPTRSDLASHRVIYFLAHALLIAVGAATTMAGGTLWTAVGTSLIATGAAGAVLYVYVANTESVRDTLEMLQSTGLKMIYGRRAAQIRDEYATRLAGARDHVDLMGFGLKDFRRDYIAALGEIAARAQVRILVLDPSSPSAGQRDVEEGQSVGTIAGEIAEFIAQFRQHYGADCPAGLELRTYDTLPLVNVFRIDDDLFWGPYLVGRASGNTLTLRVRRGGAVYDQLIETFETVWSDHSKPVGLDA